MAEGFFIPGIAMLFMSRKCPQAGLLSVALGGGYAVFAFLNGLGLLHVDWPVMALFGSLWAPAQPVGFWIGLFLDNKVSAKKVISNPP